MYVFIYIIQCCKIWKTYAIVESEMVKGVTRLLIAISSDIIVSNLLFINAYKMPLMAMSNKPKHIHKRLQTKIAQLKNQAHDLGLVNHCPCG